ncbi:MAG TPA: hypothetical protein VLZ30_02100 [Verrucomicrobiae bacterium]|nr:hypothetical protein [Verrucomicrobiae bacterium]
MKRTTTLLVAGAAMAGLMTGAAARMYASQPTTRTTTQGTILSNWGKMDDSGVKGKHDCKGKNDCKGQGGCQSGDNGCKGQNSCKGKGGCNTNKS